MCDWIYKNQSYLPLLTFEILNQYTVAIVFADLQQVIASEEHKECALESVYEQ